MKQSHCVRIWDILYPVCMYFAVTTMVLALFDLLLPASPDAKVLRQMLTSLAVLPVLYAFYRKDRAAQTGHAKQTGAQPLLWAVMALVGACAAIALNNLLGLLRIADYSASYEQVAKTFYAGSLALEIVALGFVIPLAEELLYRGIVYGRIECAYGRRCAVIASSLLFGLIHMNLVQFVYASAFGLILAYFLQRGSLLGAVAAHMAANVTSVLRAETDVFSFLEQSAAAQSVATVFLGVVSAVGMVFIFKSSEESKKRRKAA